MIGRTNSGSGGSGISNKRATFHVLAAVGSTISFSKGGVVAKVIDASKGIVSAENSQIAEYYYSISPSNYGEWTITAEWGTTSKSSTVTISENQVYDINLFRLYVYNEGVYYFEFKTTNKRLMSSTANAGYPTISNSATFFTMSINGKAGTYETINSIDVTDYSILGFNIVYSTPHCGLCGMYLGTETYYGQAPIRNSDSAAAQRFLLDISSFTGNYVVLMGLSYASGTQSMRCTSIWLVP